MTNTGHGGWWRWQKLLQVEINSMSAIRVSIIILSSVRHDRYTLAQTFSDWIFLVSLQRLSSHYSFSFWFTPTSSCRHRCRTNSIERVPFEDDEDHVAFALQRFQKLCGIVNFANSLQPQASRRSELRHGSLRAIATVAQLQICIHEHTVETMK